MHIHLYLQGSLLEHFVWDWL